MPRIRTVKPEFWSDEKLSPRADSLRLLFLGLISMADDFGRVVDSPKQIEAFVWPNHERLSMVRKHLEELTTIGVLQRGLTTSGQGIIQIANWAKHQKVDHPNTKMSLPPIAGVRASGASDSRAPRDSLANDSRTIPEPRPSLFRTSDQDQSSTTAREIEGHEFEFTTPEHRLAYVTFRRESKRPESFDARLAEMVRERAGPGGTVCTWEEIGAVLADMAANSMPFNAKLFLGCIARHRETAEPRRRAGKQTGAEINAETIASSKRALSRLVGGPAR